MSRWSSLPLVLSITVVLSSAVAAPAGARPSAPANARPSAPAAPARVVASTTPPQTPLGVQVAWLLDISHRLPLTAQEAAVHIDPSVLAQIGLGDINQALAAVSGTTGLTLVRYREPQPGSGDFLAVSDAGTWLAGISVAANGLISRLGFVVYPPAPGSWAELDRRLAALAPRTSFLAAEVTNAGCRAVHSVAAGTARPLGSAFKLYVLGALAHAVDTGDASWDEPLSIRDGWKSLPSGVLQDLPAGTALPLATYADYMIAISDNTATDHLIHRLGRPAVIAQQSRFGMRSPSNNIPFLTTRDFSVLKLARYPLLLNAYAAMPPRARAAVVHTVLPRLPLPTVDQIASWTQPRGLDMVEWYATPADICRAYAGLAKQATTPGLEPVGDALSINDGGLFLDPATWPTVWYKGGSEPGVLTLNYLARTAGGRTYVVSAMVSDPATALDETSAIAELQALVRGGFTLASGMPAAHVPAASADTNRPARINKPMRLASRL